MNTMFRFLPNLAVGMPLVPTSNSHTGNVVITKILDDGSFHLMTDFGNKLHHQAGELCTMYELPAYLRHQLESNPNVVKETYNEGFLLARLLRQRELLDICYREALGANNVK